MREQIGTLAFRQNHRQTAHDNLVPILRPQPLPNGGDSLELRLELWPPTVPSPFRALLLVRGTVPQRTASGNELERSHTLMGIEFRWSVQVQRPKATTPRAKCWDRGRGIGKTGPCLSSCVSTPWPKIPSTRNGKAVGGKLNRGRLPGRAALKTSWRYDTFLITAPKPQQHRRTTAIRKKLQKVASTELTSSHFQRADNPRRFFPNLKPERQSLVRVCQVGMTERERPTSDHNAYRLCMMRPQ